MSKRARPGERALKEVDLYQKMNRTLVPRSAMDTLIRSLLHAIPLPEGQTKKRKLSPLAVDVIQELAESYIVDRFRASQIMAIHASRITVQIEDWRNSEKVVKAMKGHIDPNEEEPINAHFTEKIDKKKDLGHANQKSRSTKQQKKEAEEEEETSELTQTYLNNLVKANKALQEQQEEETDSQDLCYQLEHESDDDSGEAESI